MQTRKEMKKEALQTKKEMTRKPVRAVKRNPVFPARWDNDRSNPKFRDRIPNGQGQEIQHAKKCMGGTTRKQQQQQQQQ